MNTTKNLTFSHQRAVPVRRKYMFQDPLFCKIVRRTTGQVIVSQLIPWRCVKGSFLRINCVSAVAKLVIEQTGARVGAVSIAKQDITQVYVARMMEPFLLDIHHLLKE